MEEIALAGPRCLVVGGSAGSLMVILNLIARLPEPPNAVVVLVVHRKKDTDSILTDLLATRTQLPVREVEDKDIMQSNTIYLAPPDYHLLFEGRSHFSLDSSEKIHHSRPSIDVTFESAAEAFGSGAIGVLLSGANADGAAGLAKIRELGGLTLVQDPATAEVSYMPEQAIAFGPVDRILSMEAMAEFLQKRL